MTVVINEFEVVMDQPEEPPAGPQRAEEQRQPRMARPAPAPHDIRDILYHVHIRQERLSAH